MAAGLTAEHASPTGILRRMSVSGGVPFARHFTVYLANRKVGLHPAPAWLTSPQTMPER